MEPAAKFGVNENRLDQNKWKYCGPVRSGHTLYAFQCEICHGVILLKFNSSFEYSTIYNFCPFCGYKMNNPKLKDVFDLSNKEWKEKYGEKRSRD